MSRFGPDLSAVISINCDDRSMEGKIAGLNCSLQLCCRIGLDLLEPRLVHSDATVIIPSDDCVIFVRLLNCAEFSGWLTEVAQTLDPISGTQLLAAGRGLGKPRLLGSIRVRGCTAVCQWRLRSFTQLSYRMIGDIGHIRLFLPKGL